MSTEDPDMMTPVEIAAEGIKSGQWRVSAMLEPTDEDVDAVAQWNVRGLGSIPEPALLAKFHRQEDYIRLGRRVWELTSGDYDDVPRESDGTVSIYSPLPRAEPQARKYEEAPEEESSEQ